VVEIGGSALSERVMAMNCQYPNTIPHMLRHVDNGCVKRELSDTRMCQIVASSEISNGEWTLVQDVSVQLAIESLDCAVAI
jgi:hypothetical protein